MDPSQHKGRVHPQNYQLGAYGGPPPTGQYNQYGQGAPPPQGQPTNYGYPGGNTSAMNTGYPGGENMATEMTSEGQASPTPTAPSLSKMDSVPDFLPPPSYEEATEGPPVREEVRGVVEVSEDQAREALLGYVAEHCCYGKGAAQSMEFTRMVPTNAFHVSFWTLQLMAAPPGHGKSTTMFQNSQVNLEVPHTASVKSMCTSCHGRGRKLGHGGMGTQSHGRYGDRTCSWCHGRGTRMCTTCQGMGRVVCTLCAGKTQLKCYIKLTITWVNHVNDHIVERTELPDHLIRDVSGQVAFQETAPRRHQVRIVPVTQALYKWKGENSDFFIYGFENKVYAPKYPQTCCCGCTIL